MTPVTVLLHVAAAGLLLAAHAVFLFRGLRMRRTGRGPRPLDRWARAGSHGLYPLAVATGLALLLGGGAGVPGGPMTALHAVLGLAPLAAILAFAFLRPLKRRIPWLLPALNLLLFLAAAISGIL